jgi:hypothetical protein
MLFFHTAARINGIVEAPKVLTARAGGGAEEARQPPAEFRGICRAGGLISPCRSRPIHF